MTLSAGNRRKHDPEANAERLRRLNQESGDSIQKGQEQFQKSSQPIQTPGACRLCGKVGCVKHR